MPKIFLRVQKSLSIVKIVREEKETKKLIKKLTV